MSSENIRTSHRLGSRLRLSDGRTMLISSQAAMPQSAMAIYTEHHRREAPGPKAKTEANIQTRRDMQQRNTARRANHMRLTSIVEAVLPFLETSSAPPLFHNARATCPSPPRARQASSPLARAPGFPVAGSQCCDRCATMTSDGGATI